MTTHCKPVLRRALILVALLVLAGCGNKGPLVHPSHAPAGSSSAPATADSTDG